MSWALSWALKPSVLREVVAGSVEFVIAEFDVPSVEAVLAPVEHDVAGFPALRRRVAAEMAAATAVDADDVFGGMHRSTVCLRCGEGLR